MIWFLSTCAFVLISTIVWASLGGGAGDDTPPTVSL